jgi:general secretion pathway protein G
MRNRRGRRGVTAFELGALVSFVALVAGAAALIVSPRLEADRRERAERDAERIQKAALEWRRENGSGCPTLTQLVKDQVLTRSSHTEDPWGGRFRVICGDDDVIVSSAGRDGKPNTEDDVQVSRGAG